MINEQTIKQYMEGNVRSVFEQEVDQGKMSGILGVPAPNERDEGICQAYDGSPQDAVDEVREATGDEEETSSMFALPANSLSEGDECYDWFQQALDYIDETEGPSDRQ